MLFRLITFLLATVEVYFSSFLSTLIRPPVVVSNNTCIVLFLLKRTFARYSVVPNWDTGLSSSNITLLSLVNMMCALPGTL